MSKNKKATLKRQPFNDAGTDPVYSLTTFSFQVVLPLLYSIM